MATIELDKVTKVFANGTIAVDELDLDIREGELMVLVGPSGCGKTTVLRMVAGLETVSAGTVRIGDKVVNDLSPRERDVAMVFQNYALYPQLTVAENIGFPLKLRKLPKAEVARKVEAAAEMLGLTEWLDRKPAQLSGGQRQRVAMGRAIVREPAAFLMDEPLSNLDAKLRVQMRAEVAALQHRLGVATLYVTHDQVEAMTMGHRVAVLREGILQQCAEPQALYDRPANVFVASFIGSPPMNLYEAVLTSAGDAVVLGHQRIELPGALVTERPGLARYRDHPIVIGFRPEHLSLGAATDSRGRLEGRVEFTEALGSDVLVHFSIDAEAAAPEDEPHAHVVGDLSSRLESTCVARVDPHDSPPVGTRAVFALDTSGLQLFDPTSEAAVWQ
ncbi:MAG: sn-glycerol-3-phosphate ABC transporter ATP-binding protein UgpC [Actinomycetota bacterium]|nr:sn-glycerol-3-phosphate ABC transporter ATP-binding protein UgpC [Actinomycetota bacterium]